MAELDPTGRSAHDAVARCPGWGDGPEDWLEECHDCQRLGATPDVRFALRNRDGSLPPQIVTLWCDAYLPPDRPEDQRLRQLAAELEGRP